MCPRVQVGLEMSARSNSEPAAIGPIVDRHHVPGGESSPPLMGLCRADGKKAAYWHK